MHNRSLNAIPVICLILLLAGCMSANSGAGNNTSEGGIQLASWDFAEFELFFGAFVIIILMCLFKTFYPRIPYVPDYVPQSLLLICIGVIFGVIFNAASAKEIENTLWKLTPTMFFHFLLPPIVLDAAFGLYNRTFIDYLGGILIYAVLGTVFNFLIIGPLMYGLNLGGAMGGGLSNVSLNSFFLFASLIVAVDPVAVLAIFQDIGVEPGLYYMVFGESLLNDAVTVVLYEIMSEFVKVTTVSPTDIGLGVGSFFTISLGGLLVGVVYGVVSSFLTRWESHFSSIFLITMAYFSYIMGDCLGWSGIISMIGCGLMQANYAFHNLSSTALNTTRQIIKQISEISEGIIFFLIGVQLFSAEILWHTGFCLWGLVVCLIARTIVVLLLSLLINVAHINGMKISMREQIILIYGGLRGAVAFSLAILVDYNQLGHDGENVRKIIITATLFIIFVTVGLMGLTMKPLVRLFNVKLAGEKNLSLWGDMNNTMLDHTLAGVEAIVGATGRNQARVFFTRLDDKYIRRLLQRDPETHDQKIIKTYEKIALKLHYATIHPEESSSHLRSLPEALVRQHMTASESTLTLPSIVATTSDPNLQEFFVRHSVSGLSLPSRCIDEREEEQPQEEEEEVHHHQHHHHNRKSVHFGENVFGDEDKPFDPHWRRRTSLINEGRETEDFKDTFMDVMTAKSRVIKERRRSRMLPTDIETRLNTLANQRIPTMEELSKSRETIESEVAEGEEEEEEEEEMGHKRVTMMDENDSEGASESVVIPKKDYPQKKKKTKDTISFSLGGEEL
ncbi:unnamed protein product [Schistocephalus solidus]|uniref:Sodium/hydrogen exchanger n=1 Tax=Schistocephalus solidus TaxID=70667 RepID=A0A183TG57_SCHSO|nr:unnamed protein product [Schistocephalus solidus]